MTFQFCTGRGGHLRSTEKHYSSSPGPIYLLKWQNLPSSFACKGAWHVAYQAEVVGGTLARRRAGNRPSLAAVGCYVGSRHRVKPYPKTAAKGGTAQTGTWKGKGKAASTSLWLFWCDSGSRKLPPVRGEWKSSSTACRCWFKAQHKDEEAEWRPTWYLQWGVFSRKKNGIQKQNTASYTENEAQNKPSGPPGTHGTAWTISLLAPGAACCRGNVLLFGCPLPGS